MRFVSTPTLSRTVYAVRVGPLGPPDSDYGRGKGWAVAARWFGRKDGVLSASHGSLWLYCPPDADIGPDSDIEDLLRLPQDGRYGGRSHFKWDGTYLVSNHSWEKIVKAQRYLDEMLRAFPAVPDDYTGWWKF